MFGFDFIVFVGCLFGGLGVIAFVDSKTGFIPDIAVFELGVLALVWTFWFGFLDWQFMLMGAAIGGGLLWGLRVLYKQMRGIYGLGFGDVKLMAVGGALLGPFFVGYAIAIGAAVTLIWGFIFRQGMLKMGQTKIPFGPGLCFGIGALWVYQVWGGQYGA